MSECITGNLTSVGRTEIDATIKKDLFQEYEKIAVESIITSFGLDALLFGTKDQHGGDVDTIHNVRNAKNDPEFAYKNEENGAAYHRRDRYDGASYHGSNEEYNSFRIRYKEEKQQGTLRDEYTGERFSKDDKTDLDHVVAAKEIYDDPGRVLAGLSGEELANTESNFKITNPHTNRSKSDKSMEEYLKVHADEYTEEQRALMLERDREARAEIERKINLAYYTGTRFMKDTALAAGKVGARMALRQAVGFIFCEIWFAVKEEFEKQSRDARVELSVFLDRLKAGAMRGLSNAKEKYRDIFMKMKDGAVSGILASLTTTFTNIFFTTSKNLVKVIRLSWVSVVDALKILIINPEHVHPGDQITSALKVLATGASIVIGSLLSDCIGKSGLAAIPEVGPVIQSFMGAFTTGILTCTLLYYLDHDDKVQSLVEKMNAQSAVISTLEEFKAQAEYLDRYAAELMNIDLEQFCKETAVYHGLTEKLTQVSTEEELESTLGAAFQQLGLSLPWKGDFDDFMSDPDSVLVFD